MELLKALEMTDSLIAHLDANTMRYIYVNDAYERVLGYRKEDLIGSCALDLLHSDDKHDIGELVEKAVNDGSEETQTETIEFRMRDSQDKWHDLRSKASLSGHDIYVVSHDVTDIRSKERELRDIKERDSYIIANIADGIYHVNLEGTILFCNQGLADMLGYSKKTLTGRNYKQFTPDEYIPTVFQAFNEVYRQGKPKRELSWQLRRRDEKLIDINTSVTPMYEGDSMTGFYGTAKDMTTYNNNRHLHAMLKTIGALSHEINSPLFAVQGNTELMLMEKDRDDPDYLRLGRIHEQVKRIGEVMQKIRDVKEFRTRPYVKDEILDISCSKTFYSEESH